MPPRPLLFARVKGGPPVGRRGIRRWRTRGEARGLRGASRNAAPLGGLGVGRTWTPVCVWLCTRQGEGNIRGTSHGELQSNGAVGKVSNGGQVEGTGGEQPKGRIGAVQNSTQTLGFITRPAPSTAHRGGSAAVGGPVSTGSGSHTADGSAAHAPLRGVRGTPERQPDGPGNSDQSPSQPNPTIRRLRQQVRFTCRSSKGGPGTRGKRSGRIAV